MDTRHTSCEVINMRVLVQHSFVSHKIRINKKNNYKQSSNVQNIPRYEGFFKMFQITFVSSSNATFSGTKGNSNLSQNVSPLRMRKCCYGSEQLLDVRLHHMKPPSLKIQFLRSMRYVSIWKKKTVKKIPSLNKSVSSMILKVDLIQSARKSFTWPH